MYSPQDPYSPQPPNVPPYSPQSPYPNYPNQGPYPPQYPNMPQRNVLARRAMINGIISIVLSLLTLFTLIGFAGVITGTFAIIHGLRGLSIAQRLPNKVGYGQAITGIVLGCLGWLIVILSFVLRSPTGF